MLHSAEWRQKQKRHEKRSVTAKIGVPEIAALSRIFAKGRFGCRHDKQNACMELANFLTQWPNISVRDRQKASALAVKSYPTECPTCGQKINPSAIG